MFDLPYFYFRGVFEEHNPGVKQHLPVVVKIG